MQLVIFFLMLYVPAILSKTTPPMIEKTHFTKILQKQVFIEH